MLVYPSIYGICSPSPKHIGLPFRVLLGPYARTHLCKCFAKAAPPALHHEDEAQHYGVTGRPPEGGLHLATAY